MLSKCWKGVWVCGDTQLKTLACLFAHCLRLSRGQNCRCLLIPPTPASEPCLVEHGFIWYVPAHLCCYINAPLCKFSLFIFHRSSEKGGVGMCFRRYSRDCIHQFLRELRNYFSLLQSEKSTLPVPVHRWMTVVSSVGLYARRCVSPLLSICSSLCSLSGKQNAVMREGGKAAVWSAKAWWEAWWWQAWGIWYGCPLQGFIVAADKMKEKYFATFCPQVEKVEKPRKEWNHVAHGSTFITLQQRWRFIKAGQVIKPHVLTDWCISCCWIQFGMKKYLLISLQRSVNSVFHNEILRCVLSDTIFPLAEVLASLQIVKWSARKKVQTRVSIHFGYSLVWWLHYIQQIVSNLLEDGLSYWWLQCLKTKMLLVFTG